MAGMQPPTISGPKTASGPLNGLNSPTTSVAGAELQAAATTSAKAAPSDVTASLIPHLSLKRTRRWSEYADHQRTRAKAVAWIEVLRAGGNGDDRVHQRPQHQLVARPAGRNLVAERPVLQNGRVLEEVNGIG